MLASCLAFCSSCLHPFKTPKLVLLALVVILIARRGEGCRQPLGLLLLLIWPVVGALWLTHRLDFLLAMTLILLACFALLATGPLKPDIRQAVCHALAMAGVFTAVYLVVQLLGLDPFSWEKGALAGSFFGNPNFSGHFLLLALTQGQFGKGHAGFAQRAVIGLGLILCQSRAVWIATACWYGLNYAQFDVVWRRLTNLALMLTLVYGGWNLRHEVPEAIAYFTQPDDYAQSFSLQPEIIDYRDSWYHGKRASLMIRYIMWRNTIELIADHPWRGVAAGQYRVHYPYYANAVYKDINMGHQYRPHSPHNLLLEAAATFGVPWSLLAAWYLWRSVRHARPDRDYHVALGLQALLALVSLNYLNPVVVLTVILLRPGPSELRQAASRPHWPLPVLVIAIAALDLNTNETTQKLFRPATLAASHYANGEYARAWRWQLRALEQDPRGPEVIYNLAVIASMRYLEEGEPWLKVAVLTHQTTQTLYPFYRHAQDQLNILEIDYGPLQGDNLPPQVLLDSLFEY